MDYDIGKIRGGKNDGKFYLRNNEGGVSQLFDSAEEAEIAGFKHNVIWEYLDD